MTRNSPGPLPRSSFSPNCCIAVKIDGPLAGPASGGRIGSAPGRCGGGAVSSTANSRWKSYLPASPVLSTVGRSSIWPSLWQNSLSVVACVSNNQFGPLVVIWPRQGGVVPGAGGSGGSKAVAKSKGTQLPSLNECSLGPFLAIVST